MREKINRDWTIAFVIQSVKVINIIILLHCFCWFHECHVVVARVMDFYIFDFCTKIIICVYIKSITPSSNSLYLHLLLHHPLENIFNYILLPYMKNEKKMIVCFKIDNQKTNLHQKINVILLFIFYKKKSIITELMRFMSY